MRRRFSLIAASAACLWASGVWAASSTVPAKPAHRAASKAAPAAHAAVDAPFWQGHPDAAAFRKRNEERLAAAKAQIAKLVAVKGPRTIENTLQPYDEATRFLDAAGSQSGLMENVHPDSALRGTAEEITQAVSAYGTAISLNRDVYKALSSLDLSKADAETKYYVWRELRNFRLSGVDKDDATRAKIKVLSDEIVKLGQEFERNIRSDVRTIHVKPADLAGMPQDFLDGHKPGADGMVTLDINYPDYIPIVTYCANDDVRHRLYMEFQNRAYPANGIVLHRLLEARDSLAHLVDFKSYADYTLANRMAKDDATARAFLQQLEAASTAAQNREWNELLKRRQKDDPAAKTIQFWQQGYYEELVKRANYDFDSQQIRPYLPFDRVRQGVLDVASKIFHLEFKPVANAPVWDPSVECFEVFDSGKRIGRFYLDMHPRPNKYNHAAQFDIRTGVKGKQIAEAALVCNLPGGKPGDPGLCDIDDVNTVFHEFGHLMHTILAGNHRWCGVGGIRTERDFVEAPSQMLEEWMRDPKVLQTFAKHYQKGEPVPTEMVIKMQRAQDFAKGIHLRRQLVYSDLSLSIYDRDPASVDLDSMMKSMVAKYQPFPFVDGTHFYDSFGHLVGYSAAYYTYQWSLVIAKDMFSQFNKVDLLDPTVSMRYRRAVLEPGGSAPAADLVKNFLGRPFSFDAYRQWLDSKPGNMP
jgi:thimet oligopeptidase